jgi:hypothetical protein
MCQMYCVVQIHVDINKHGFCIHTLKSTFVVNVEFHMACVKCIVLSHKVKDGTDSFNTCAQDMVSGYELAVALDRVEIVKVCFEMTHFICNSIWAKHASKSIYKKHVYYI